MACDCIDKYNDHLSEKRNALLSVGHIVGPEALTEEIDFDNPKPGSLRVKIEVEKADSSKPYLYRNGKRGEKPAIIPTYCPFCGTRYVAETPQENANATH